MDIFWRLMLGHFLADFTFQVNAIAAWKRTSHWGLLLHCLMHPLFYIVLTWPYLGETWFAMETASCPGTGWIGLRVMDRESAGLK